MVRITKELTIQGVNFCALRQKEKKALKANWDAQISEKVETGRYNRPIEYRKLSAASNTPKERYMNASAEASGWFTLRSRAIFLDDKMQR